ncbi:MAG: prolipoprotein diacylglyceryl transferase [Actinomycetes bacterium]
MSAPLLAFIPAPPTNGFEVGPLFFHLYGLCIALGVLAAFWLANRRWVEAGGKPGELERPAIWAVIAGFLGGRLGYVITHTGDFRGRWLHVVAIWEGGLALYGGLTVGILTGLWVARRRGLPVLRALDAAIPAIPLAQAFGRWGNYFNQELFGRPTKLPWGLEIDLAHRPPGYEKFATFHPTFLYECVWNLGVFGLVLWLDRKLRLGFGRVFALYVMGYCLGRFWIEHLRIDTIELNDVAGLRWGEWMSIVLFIGALVYFVVAGRRHPAPNTREDSVYVEGREPVDADASEEADRESAAVEPADVEPADSSNGSPSS